MAECSGEKVPVDICAIYIPVMSTYLAWRVNRNLASSDQIWEEDSIAVRLMAGAVEGVYVTMPETLPLTEMGTVKEPTIPPTCHQDLWDMFWCNVVAIQGVFVAQMACLVGCRLVFLTGWHFLGFFFLVAERFLSLRWNSRRDEVSLPIL